MTSTDPTPAPDANTTSGWTLPGMVRESAVAAVSLVGRVVLFWFAIFAMYGALFSFIGWFSARVQATGVATWLGTGVQWAGFIIGVPAVIVIAKSLFRWLMGR